MSESPASPGASIHSSHWLVLNGKSRDDEDLRAAVAKFREGGATLQVRVTWEQGDAERYAADAIAAGAKTLIAAGGDGTLSAVAGALAKADVDAAAVSLPALALVPLGTANDFAIAAGISCDPAEALALVLDTAAQPIDLLRIACNDNEHWCANLASGGFGTQVTLETDEGLKEMLGGLAYMITGISRLGRIDPITARLHGPDFDWQGGFIALGLGNGRQAGGGQVLCPEAVINDGLLDVTVVPELEGEVGSTVASLITEGKQAALERVAIRRQLPWVEIQTPQPFTLNLDGEPVESTRLHIGCEPGRVRMHLPPGCPLLRPPVNPLADAPGGRESHPGRDDPTTGDLSPGLLPA